MLDILSESEQIEFALLVLLKNKDKAEQVLKNKIPSGKGISLEDNKMELHRIGSRVDISKNKLNLYISRAWFNKNKI